jgi:hypothetical protein
MIERPEKLDDLLRASELDRGCDAGAEVIEVYVELELAGEDAESTYPWIAAHLRSCKGCRSDHDGLLEAARRDSEEPPNNDSNRARR